MGDGTRHDSTRHAGTDYVGHIYVEPPLNSEEIAYLTDFATSRRCGRGDPYDLPADREESRESAIDDIPGPGQPGLWCDWDVAEDGSSLYWSGAERSDDLIPWLRYLIAHFLRPRAKACTDRRFAGFTFDHRLSGIVVGCRRDGGELFAIRVANNRVSRRVLRTAGPGGADRPMPRQRAEVGERPPVRRQRRSRSRSGEMGVVVDLDSWRA
jgi:hypothetical protein